MTKIKPTNKAQVAEEWGSWDDAERWHREAFRDRSSRARLAWLEDLLKLWHAAGQSIEPLTAEKDETGQPLD